MKSMICVIVHTGVRRRDFHFSTSCPQVAKNIFQKGVDVRPSFAIIETDQDNERRKS